MDDRIKGLEGVLEAAEERLTRFIYHLLYDHVPLSVIDDALVQVGNAARGPDSALKALARDRAQAVLSA